jgi:hypothetical protein
MSKNFVGRLATAVERQNLPQICSILHQIGTRSEDNDVTQHLSDLAEAIKTNLWAKVKARFLNPRFIDDQGKIFILAPYLRRINGQDVVKLTFLQGNVCSYSLVKMEAIAISVFGKLNQEIPKLLIIDVETAAGNIGNEESFIAPGGWIL